MSRWWKGVAVFAAWLGCGMAATQAQQEVPTPVGAARMIEPLRYTPEPQPDLVPGPITPLVAPPGPPENLSLPSGHSSAFQLENYTMETAAYGSAGGFGLARYHPGSIPVAFNNSPNNTDTGILPYAPIPKALDLHDVNPDMAAGVRATIGYLWGDQAIEITGMYQPAKTTSKQVVAPGAYTVPFNAPNNSFPIGFEGDNGLWTQADRVRVSYLSSVGGAEINYRTWNSAVFGAELILGVRYLSTRERLSILTDDDYLAKNPFGQSDPTKAATYSVGTLNNIVGPQIGWEYSTPCPIPCMGWIWFSGMGKAAVGGNYVQRSFNLSRGDGLEAYNFTRSNVQVGQVYEIDAFIDFHILERLRLRAGYTALWAVGVSNPAYQMQYDLTEQAGRKAEQGSAMWHGPIAEIEFLW